MPQQTFLNLDPVKQRTIIDACLEEFVQHDYRNASMNRIIQKVGLAKGSFYRYFTSKRELYEYLLEYAGSHSLDLFEEVFADPVEDILDAWVLFFLACAEQDNSYPLLGYFGYRISRDRYNIALGDVPRQTLVRGFEHLSARFRQQQDQGKIRSDVAADKLIYVLLQVQAGFLDYLSIAHDIDFEANVCSGQPLFTLPMEVLREELVSFADLLRNGFAASVPASGGGG